MYFYIFVVVDTRQQNEEKDSLAGLSMELRSLVERVISFVPLDLDPRVGLFRTDYSRTKDSLPLTEGSFYGHLVRRAQVVSQPPELTQWVRKKLTKN